MVSHAKILELIDQKQVDRLIPIVQASREFKESESLRVRLWDTFLPPCHVGTDVFELSDRTIEQLQKDIQRSFHHFKDIPDGKIGKLREKLLKLMTRIFEHPFYQNLTETEQELHYYQSFHDIAAILILKFGYKNGLKFLERLCRSHLRDFMDADFSHTKAFSQFVIELVKRLDKDLAEKLESIQMPPFFFVSWCLAWFSHDLELSSEISCIFDGLVMLPPAAVGYVSALLIHRGRDLVLNYDAELGSDGFGHLHQSLKTLPRNLWSPTILADAHALMLQYPPSTIIGKDPILGRSSFDQDLAPSQRPIIYGKYAVVGIPLAILLFAIILKTFDGRPTIDHA